MFLEFDIKHVPNSIEGHQPDEWFWGNGKIDLRIYLHKINYSKSEPTNVIWNILLI